MGFNLGQGNGPHHPSWPAHSGVSWCLWRLRPRLHRVKALLVNFAALCSVAELWEWMTNGDSHHMQVSFYCPQGWTGAKILPCSSSFGKANCWCQRIASSLLPPQQGRHLFLFYLECKGGTTLLPPSSLFLLAGCLPFPSEASGHPFSLKWVNKSKQTTYWSLRHPFAARDVCTIYLFTSLPTQSHLVMCLFIFQI